MKEFKVELSDLIRKFIIKDVDKNIEKVNNKLEMVYVYMGDTFKPIGGIVNTGYDVVRLQELHKKPMRQLLLEAECSILKKIYPDERIALHIRTTELAEDKKDKSKTKEAVTLDEIEF